MLIPSILAHDAHEVTQKLFWPGICGQAERFHVDVLDGSMFGTKCFHDPGVLIGRAEVPKIELHLMVENPLPILESWLAVTSSVTHAIIHAEVGRPVGTLLERIAARGVVPSLAINPETSVDSMAHHFNRLNELLIMGVHPGESGRSFLGESIIAKVIRTRRLHPALTLGIDGGATASTIPQLKQAGIANFVVGSAIWQAPNPAQTYAELSALVGP